MFVFRLLVSLFCALFALANVNVDKSMLTAGNPKNFVADGCKYYNSTSSSYGWVEYKQCDSRWAGQELGNCGSLTICSAGCAMSSVAMMLATKGANLNPASLDSWLTTNGGYANGCDIYWGAVDAFGYTKFQGHQNANENEICNGLSQGHGIIANVRGGSHWVLLTACLGNGVFAVNDPGFNVGTYSMSDIVVEAVYH